MSKHFRLTVRFNSAPFPSDNVPLLTAHSTNIGDKLGLHNLLLQPHLVLSHSGITLMVILVFRKQLEGHCDLKHIIGRSRLQLPVVFEDHRSPSLSSISSVCVCCHKNMQKSKLTIRPKHFRILHHSFPPSCSVPPLPLCPSSNFEQNWRTSKLFGFSLAVKDHSCTQYLHIAPFYFHQSFICKLFNLKMTHHAHHRSEKPSVLISNSFWVQTTRSSCFSTVFFSRWRIEMLSKPRMIICYGLVNRAYTIWETENLKFYNLVQAFIISPHPFLSLKFLVFRLDISYSFQKMPS